MFYREIPPDTVPAITRQAAVDALSHSCRLLGFALAPTIIWVRGPVTDAAELARVVALPRINGGLDRPGYRFSARAFNGLVDSRRWVMWIRADMSQRETFITVAHECGHLAYSRRGWKGAYGSPARDAEEADVEAFAQAVYRRLAA